MEKYIPAKIEAKWRSVWAKEQKPVDLLDSKKPSSTKVSEGKKYYLLVEFTYPSGDLHMGHWFAFAVPDILGRMKRMQGYTVFAPNGFDAFGLPAENAAIQRKIHPRDWTLGNIERMKKQFETMGGIYDWEHEVITCDSNYYKWNQWIFLKMFEKGLAYRGKTLSNWCPVDQTVLANENVENGKCWRCGAEVVQKEVEQWFLKITDYAQRLLWPSDFSTPGVEPGSRLENTAGVSHGNVDWPKSLREGQNNWIGKSEGIEIEFRVKSLELSISVFTKFPETIFGVTYMVLAPEHIMVRSLTTDEHKKEVEKYIKEAQKKSELARISLDKAKSGIFTGSYVVNPVNNREVPIWIADYVISTYGTGAVMGVPGSDHRDFEFAKKYDIEVVKVIARSKNDQSPIESAEHVLEEGYIVNSGQFDGLSTPVPAGEKIMAYLEEKGWGRRKINYHLHDWSISRQRYWGTPIPIIYCRNCARGPVSSFFPVSARSSVKSGRVKGASLSEAKGGSLNDNVSLRAVGNPFTVATPRTTLIDGEEHAIIPVPEKDLPVELPYDVDFAPRGKPPLATAEDWVRVKCPNCGGEARREVETMDTFVDSSWYFLRYLRDVSSGPVSSFLPASAQSGQKSNGNQVDPADLRAVGNPSRTATRRNELPWNPDYVKAWMPVDIYFGGAEHTLGHTLYSRFFVKFLQDIGVLPNFAEYARKRVQHGVILGPDGSRMSKSRGNVVNPDDGVKQYGADAVRMYLAFLGPYDLVAPWNPGGIGGVYNFLQRTWKLMEKVDIDSQDNTPGVKPGEFLYTPGVSPEDLYWMHKTIKKVTDDIESIKFNTAVAALMEWLNYLSTKAHKSSVSSSVILGTSEARTPESDAKQDSGQARMTNVGLLEYKTFLKLLAPFAPHITEELWQRIRSKSLIVNGKSKKKNDERQTINDDRNWSIHSQPWPEYDRELAEAKQVTLVVQVNGRVRDKLLVEAGISQKDAEKLALNTPRVQKYLDKKAPQKIIFVPDRLINLVV